MKYISSLIILCSFVNSALIGQTWSKIGTGANGTVHSITTHLDGLAIGGEFKEFNAFNRYNFCFIRENSLDDYSYFSTYSADFDRRASGAKEIGTAVYASVSVGDQLHVGGKFFHPDYLSDVSLGYFSLDTADNSTPFMGYDEQLTAGSSIFCMEKFDGRVFFGGDFVNLGPVSCIGSVDLSSSPNYQIESIGSGLNGIVRNLAFHNGELYAGGEFLYSANGDTLNHIAKWNGNTWIPVGRGFDGGVYTLKSFQGKLYAGGMFTKSDSVSMMRIASWNDTNWNAVGSGFTDSSAAVFALESYSDTLYAAGAFRTAGFQSTKNLAKFDGNDWVPLGKGLNDTVFCLKSYRGRLYIGGSFTLAHDQVVRNIVTYNNGKEKLGINEQVTDNSTVTLYPNPASTELRIQASKQIGRVEIWDLKGNKVIESTNSIISVNQLPNGLYLAKINLEGSEFQMHKLIIAR
jgi:hypothetical protein